MIRRSSSRLIHTLLATAWMLRLCQCTDTAFGADEPEIHVAVSADEIFAGESIDYQVEIRNSKNPSAPDLSSIKQVFDVVSKGDASRNQSSTFTFNGRTTQQNVLSHIYQYQLTPKSTGKLEIPSAVAAVDGKTLTSDTIALRVIPAEKQDLVIAEVETSRARVYPTQPFTVTLKVLIKPLPNHADRDPLTPLRNSPPHIQLNWADPPNGLAAEDKTRWLQPMLASNGVGFSLNDVTARTGSFFDGDRVAVFNLLQGREERTGDDGDPIRYFSYELTRTLTAEKTGTYSFGPVVVKGTFVSTFEREYKGRRLVTSAPMTSVEVLEVPSPRPPTFCGGIGEYQVAASASPTKLRVGDPLTLTIEFARSKQSGSLELIAAPDLSALPQVAADFELVDKNPTGRVEGEVKKFAYAMRPKHANVSIPSLNISTFDPQTEHFVSLETAAIPLDVTEADHVTSGDLVGTRPAAETNTIKSKAQGIFQNITDPSELKDQRISLVFWAEAAVGVWCATGIVIAIVSLYRRRVSDPAWVRRRQARGMANRRLTEAKALIAQGKSVEALQHVRSAIVGFVADTRNGIAEGMTTADVLAGLSTSSVQAEDQSAMSHLLEVIESAAYGAADSNYASSAVETATGLIARLSPYLGRGS